MDTTAIDRNPEDFGSSSTAEFDFVNPEDIDKAIVALSQVLPLIPNGHAQKPTQLTALGILFNSRFEFLGELADSDKAVDYFAQAVHITPTGHALKPSWLNNLALAYHSRFKRLGQLSDLDKAIEYQTQAVLQTPDDHADKPCWLKNLGNSHSRRFRGFGEATDLEKAIDCSTQAVSLTPSDHAHKPYWLIDLGNSHRIRFQRLGDIADLNKTVDCWTQAVLLTPDGHIRKSGWLSDLGLSYLSRFACGDKLEDLDKAIECQTEAVQLAPEGQEDKRNALNNLGISYQSRFGRTGELADVNKAIDSLTQAVSLTPGGHTHKSIWLTNLGLAYMSRFKRFDKLDDLDKAIECQTQLVQLVPDGQNSKLNSLNYPQIGYRSRYESLVDLSHAGDKRIECNFSAELSTPGDQANKPIPSNSLNFVFLSRFESLNERTDLDKAVKYDAQAAQLTTEVDFDKSHWLADLGTSYSRRFRRLGELTDADKAVDRLSQALLLAPVGRHLDRAVWLSDLGLTYWSRFEHLGEVADLDRAIDCLTQAVLLSPDNLSSLINLGLSYLSRFTCLDDLADLEKAIECQTQAVQLFPDGHTDKSYPLNNLGISYQARFDRLGELVDLSKAIDFKTQALLHAPEGYVERPRWLSNIGNSYRSRFRHLGEVEDLGKAIQCQTQAILLTPDGHAYKPLYLTNLANSYLDRFNFLGDLADLEHARSAFRDAARLAVARPQLQFECARMWAKCSCQPGLSPRFAYERCMELIPHLIWVGRTINQRYNLVSQIDNLASEAAAWAISEQAYDRALEWLEQGRSIVWNQISQLRTPFDDLFSIDPALAQQLKDISTNLEAAGTRPTPVNPSIHQSSDLERDAQYHRQLATEWERLLEQARNLPGLQSFLLARKAEELKLAATDGPVVVINTHSTRCDALIIFPNCKDITHVPLQNFSIAKLVTARELSDSLVRGRGGRARGFKRSQPETKWEDGFQSLLYALWSDIIKPILDSLDCTRTRPVDELPHVTWCTTGALSFLPLHAAGCYDGSQPNAFDLTVSSYTPTLSALLSSRAPVFNPDNGVLAVGQEHTPGFCSLPNTVQELAVIQELAKGTRFHQLSGEKATVDAVLNAMDVYSWVHLACHATQNPDNPAHSAFHLHDGALTLEAITKRSFKNKGLAFLSACQTATGDERLSDEAVHLAAGMLIAGYPSVIATMWKIRDEDGPRVAQGVYAYLLKHTTNNHTMPVRALHEAIAGLREKVGCKAFERWLPFIHIGV